VGVVVVGVVVVVVVAQEVFCVSPDLRMSELRKSGSVCIMYYYGGWLEVNAEKTKYMFMSCKQNTGQNHNIKTANKSLEIEAKFKYLHITLNNKITFIKKLKVH
jgi:effector-binding domain-containing protein